ncbi:MAG TPA: TetR/AcrR family transcriptional regulator [Nevskiaceae bacterium]|nr:TetR/AcrR family transcriptional regulator [Nevskiaceae bacterium]
MKIRKPKRDAERTRADVLAAAEDLFARRGYEVARLEDVAEMVGITRPALFYHFRDKQTLYNAVLEDAFGSLASKVAEALSTRGSVPLRVERATEAWVDAVVARPTLARLILRHIADIEQHPTHRMYAASDRLLRGTFQLFEQGRASGELKPLHDDPFYAASNVIGTTVFYVSALAPLLPSNASPSLGPEQVKLLKSEVLKTVRRLLGFARPRQSAAR